MICTFIYADQGNLSLGGRVPAGWLVWAQFPFVRGIYLMNNACVTNLACYGPIWTLEWSDELAPSKPCSDTVTFNIALIH